MIDHGTILDRPARTAGIELPRRATLAPALLTAALWLVFAANAGVLIWLWLKGGGVTAVPTTADLETSIGRITGLLGAYLALVQVLLLARLPPLERLVGFDRLTVWHRRNGRAVILLLLAHTALVTVGYAGSDQVRLGAEISSLWHDYPGIVTATIGTGLLCLVVGTSLVIVRRRLPYELWHLVHLMAYAGIALAWSHQIPTGNEFTTAHTASQYWTGLILVTLVLLVAFRIVLPLVRALALGLRVGEVREEAPGVVSLVITGRGIARVRARSGQFMLWRFLTPGRALQAHPFSLSRAPDGRSLRITVKDSGRFTARLRDLRPGTRVLAEGPFGTFTDAARRRPRAAYIAGGIGITPIRAMLETAPGAGGDLALIYRVVDERDAIFRDELEALARARGARLTIVAGDHRDDACRDLLSPDHLRALVDDIAERDVYVCGPPAMADGVVASLRELGVPRRQIHLERFAL
ncbi:MAG TPA: ferredoxin reductase family protein [Solirubrobacteraceae bacterium]|nr:ferredoxin reductase family protein [Solirubrobacteraceae bacterium]